MSKFVGDMGDSGLSMEGGALKSIDVIIVGAGLCGLQAATDLQNADLIDHFKY